MVTSSAPHKNAAGRSPVTPNMSVRPESSAAPIKIVGLSGEVELYRSLLDELGIADLVSFMPFLAEAELRSLYRRARAVLIPSFAEGFGIPLLEAMATGTPVLTSNVTSLPEVGGPAPFYFDPRKPAEIGSAIEAVMKDSSLQQKWQASDCNAPRTSIPRLSRNSWMTSGARSRMSKLALFQPFV